MLNKISLGNYYPINSKIHFMNQTSKILSLFIFILGLLFATSIVESCLFLALSFFMIEMSHLPKMLYLNVFDNLKFFFLLLIVICYLLGLDLYATLTIILDIYSFSLYITMISLTTPPTDIMLGLARMLYPFKKIGFNVEKISFNLAMAIRFLPIMFSSNNRIMKTQASRGLDFYASSVRGKVISIKSKIVPSLVMTFRKIKNIKQSMQISLYNPFSNRTSFISSKWSTFDSYIVIVHFMVLVILIVRKMVL